MQNNLNLLTFLLVSPETSIPEETSLILDLSFKFRKTTEMRFFLMFESILILLQLSQEVVHLPNRHFSKLGCFPGHPSQFGKPGWISGIAGRIIKSRHRFSLNCQWSNIIWFKCVSTWTFHYLRTAINIKGGTINCLRCFRFLYVPQTPMIIMRRMSWIRSNQMWRFCCFVNQILIMKLIFHNLCSITFIPFLFKLILKNHLKINLSQLEHFRFLFLFLFL